VDGGYYAARFSKGKSKPHSDRGRSTVFPGNSYFWSTALGASATALHFTKKRRGPQNLCAPQRFFDSIVL